MAKNETRKHRTRPPRGAASPTSARRLEALEKQRQALALRMAGASFDEIAESLGYADRGGAHKAVMAAIASTLPEPAGQVRELELKRLDRLWLAVWDAATKGDLQAVDACLKIMKRRADFEGLDKAKKHEHSGPDGGPLPLATSGQVTIYIPDNGRDPIPTQLAGTAPPHPTPAGPPGTIPP